MPKELELRHMTAEVRSEGEGEDKKVAGVGVVYDRWVEIWPGFMERVKKDAVEFAGEVKSFFNHNPEKVLSALDSDPPLKLRKTDKGLEYVSPIPPTSYGKDLEVNLERKNVKGSSFAFEVTDSKTWNEEKNDERVYYRDIKKLVLHEIGPVTNPAYIQTSAALRSAEDTYKEFLAAMEREAEADKEKKRLACQVEAERRERELELLEYESF